jgi:hypothetical protein
MMGPLPVVVFIGCTHGPPDEPPLSPQLPSHQSSASNDSIISAQYMNCGSTS